MSLVYVGKGKCPSPYGRDDEYTDMWIDTDDLDDDAYYFYRKAEKLGEVRTMRRILTGQLTTEEIRQNPEYAYLLL